MSSAKKVDFDESTASSDEKTSVVQTLTFDRRLQQMSKMPPSVVLLMGPAGYVGRHWSLESSDIIIGRSMSSNIFIDDRSVSKSHARITISFGEISIIDLDSTNKTIINGVAIPPFVAKKLENNDQVKVGSVLFKFLAQGSLEAVAAHNMQEKSEKDALTSIWNKGALTAKGVELVKRSKLLAQPLALIVFDIDHFKKVNDTYSHQAGDYILKELASVIQLKMIRTDDYFARFGGEEFVIALTSTSIKVAEEIAERIRQTVEKHEFNYENKKIPITVSIGVSELEPEMTSFDELFAKADTALYASKNSGRNRVTCL